MGFFDGLLHLAAPPSQKGEVEGGWRVVEADGKNLLEAENFVAANRFTVREGAEAAFEERWAKRDSGLADLPTTCPSRSGRTGRPSWAGATRSPSRTPIPRARRRTRRT